MSPNPPSSSELHGERQVQRYNVLLKVEKDIQEYLRFNDLKRAKSLFEQTNWEDMVIPGRLWVVATEVSLSPDIKAWLSTLKSLEQAISYWSLTGDTFVGLSKNNPELFDHLAYLPDIPYADYLYSAILKDASRQGSATQALWEHLRDDVGRRWVRDGDVSAFSSALLSDNRPAIHWLLEVGEDWKGFSKALKSRSNSDFDQVVSILESLQDKTIEWNWIAQEFGEQSTLEIRSALEKSALEKSMPKVSNSKLSTPRI